MLHSFTAIKQSKVSEEIVDQIKELISNGHLLPGEKLPSERQLAQMLEVGRSSLREAINSLSMMGLVKVKRRKGIYVGTVSAPLISDPLRELMTGGQKTFADLYDIRIDIEVASAMAAAEKRTDEQLQGIGKSLSIMRNDHGKTNYSTEHDLRFHLQIAEATNNFLRVHIVKEIFDLAGNHIDDALKMVASQQENVEIMCDQHTAIFNAITEKKPSTAGTAMKSHLEWVMAQLNTFL